MAETLRTGRRSGFLVPGNWILHPHRPMRESKRVVKWPTSPNPRKESAKPTGSVVGFMKWMRQVMDVVEKQKRKRANKDLATMVVEQTVKKARKG